MGDPRLGERQVRQSLLSLLQDRHRDDPDTLIRHEMGLCAGARRVDLAVINGELAGFEIKSDQDTLERLAGQAADYGRVLDRVTLVTTDRYLVRAAALVPDWWGLVRAAPADGDETGVVELGEVRAARVNSVQDPFAVAQLLWRDEALAILRARGQHKGVQRERRWLVWERLATVLPLPELRRLVCVQLKARQAWPGGQ
ncbi:sce7726 family protein [Actinomadura welshii]|uniref:sce7726 family protein n=1 Tax=Actinomadura welshii TaxID=3103817 RepID=UPI0004675D7E|nr:sce7726 family protein [Actinomadura madurae]